MSARYGLPDHLIELVGATVTELAVNIVEPTDGETYALVWLWSDRVEDGDHLDLLTAAEAAQLLKVFKTCVEYVYTNPSDYALDIALAIHADEILTFLQDVAQPVPVAA
jgi:hypothetical protein